MKALSVISRISILAVMVWLIEVVCRVAWSENFEVCCLVYWLIGIVEVVLVVGLTHVKKWFTK